MSTTSNTIAYAPGVCVNKIHASIPKVVQGMREWLDRCVKVRSRQEPSALSRDGIRGKMGLWVDGIPRIEEAFTLFSYNEHGLCEQARIT